MSARVEELSPFAHSMGDTRLTNALPTEPSSGVGACSARPAASGPDSTSPPVGSIRKGKGPEALATEEQSHSNRPESR